MLFATELAERFSYYGMRGILTLYLTASDEGAPGWTSAQAVAFYGTYTMSVYLASVPGGIIADRWLGQRRAVLIGAVLLAGGHGVLAIPGMTAFYSGVALIVAGVGLLKPNISTMVGQLYGDGDARRDRGFMIFYMGINVGATAPLFVGPVAEGISWHLGFGMAGVAMLLSLVVYGLGMPLLRGIGEPPGRHGDGDADSAGDAAKKRPAREPLSKVDRDRVVVLLVSFLIVVVFWAAYEQAGGLLNLYTDAKIDRTVMGVEIPASVFQSLPALYIVFLAVPVGVAWDAWRRGGGEANALFKMGLGTMIMGLGFVFLVFAANDAAASPDGKAAMYWLFLAYLFHVLGELCVSPVALSYITKLAPVGYASIMMGAYFAVTGLANKLAGKIGEYAVKLGERPVFIGIAAFAVFFGLLLLAFRRRLQAMTHGAEDLASDDASGEASDVPD